MKRSFFSKHRQEIKTGLGIFAGLGALGSTVVFTIKAHNSYLSYLKENDVEKIPKKELFKLVWKYYVPSILLEMASVSFMISSTKDGKDSIMALSAACLNADSMLKTYKEKVVETIGENKERQIRDSIISDEIKANPVSSNEIIVTKEGNTLIYDMLSGQYFKSDIETIKKTINELNRRMRDDIYISVNELLAELNIRPMDKVGDMIGWNINKGYIDVYFGAQLTENNEPCIVLYHSLAPTYEFDKL